MSAVEQYRSTSSIAYTAVIMHSYGHRIRSTQNYGHVISADHLRLGGSSSNSGTRNRTNSNTPLSHVAWYRATCNYIGYRQALSTQRVTRSYPPSGLSISCCSQLFGSQYCSVLTSRLGGPETKHRPVFVGVKRMHYPNLSSRSFSSTRALRFG